MGHLAFAVGSAIAFRQDRIRKVQTVSTLSFTDLPDELKALRRWVTWRHEVRRGSVTKRPGQSIADLNSWLSFADASALVADGHAHGIGFVLGLGIVGIDLDGCIGSEGTLHDVARDSIGLSTYAERSPSGRGLHLLIRATIPRSRKISTRGKDPGREIYDGRTGSARFFTVTGDRIGDASEIRGGPQAQAALDTFIAKWFPERPFVNPVDSADTADQLDDEQVLRVMFDANDGAKWHRIFYGDYADYPSQSEADLALCRKLRFYARANIAQMDRLFRRSTLMRLKWDERRGTLTYGEHTLATVIARGGPFYRPRDPRGGEDEAKRRLVRERRAWGKFTLWWAVRLKGTGELPFRVLIVIASYANTKTGEAFPSIATIAAHCRVTERRVNTALNILKAAGVLKVTQRPRQSNLYQLALRVPETITPYVAQRRVPRMTCSEHLGCAPHDTVTDHDLTNLDTGRGNEAA